jgi:hypothetical protein
MVERCGDRQRKFDGLEKWPFRLFIESLPIMLQIALLLLTCGLSRYMWSVNASVARVILSFTVLGVLFYIGIVAAGTSSYECPFQTPASTGLRHLRDSETIRKLLANLSPLKAISLIHTTWKKRQQELRCAYDATRSSLSWEISLRGIRSGIRSTATKIGHQTILLLLQMDRVFRNAMQKLVQGFKRTGLLPITTEDMHRRPFVPQNRPGLRVRVWNLETIRKQNTDNARCVSWVLRNITDPEAIDCAIRLAGTIRWFDGDSDHDPPFDFIVSTFEACFDSNKQPYPGMRDRAYFSARAILQINMRARAQSRGRASKYPIPTVSSSSVQHTDPDLHHVTRMLECNLGPSEPTLDFPRGDTTTHAHSLWMSNLFVDLTHVGPNPTLRSYKSYLSAAFANHRAIISNTLLVWYIFLGGHVEEETIWAVDKSYVVVTVSFPFSLLKITDTSDSLETILSYLSTRVMNAIADGSCLQHLNYLLEFLAAWEKRPECLTPMAYQWCSAISEAAGRLEWGELSDRRQILRVLRLELQDPALGAAPHYLQFADGGFSEVGRRCGPLRSGGTSHSARGPPQALTPSYYVDLLRTTLEIGFRQATPGHDQSALRLNHTSHHIRMFETAFSSNDDEVIADVVSVWVVDGDRAPLGSCVPRLIEWLERDRPFSARLRRVSIHAIERIWRSELEVSGSETVRLLNRLDVDVEDMAKQEEWVRLLVGVIYLPTGLESLSSHYWRLLDRLAMAANFCWIPESRTVEVMKLLEEAEGWKKLEVWMVVAWQSLPRSMPTSAMEDIERATLKLFMQRASAPRRFEALCQRGSLWPDDKARLQQICDRARVNQLSLASLPTLYVSICPAQCLSVLMPPLSLPQSTDSRPAARSASFYGRRYFLKVFIVLIVD